MDQKLNWFPIGISFVAQISKKNAVATVKTNALSTESIFALKQKKNYKKNMKKKKENSRENPK